jgi:hypothetical protein
MAAAEAKAKSKIHIGLSFSWVPILILTGGESDARVQSEIGVEFYRLSRSLDLAD